jgi:RimJ/RimL family protein N-acetyltransferase
MMDPKSYKATETLRNGQIVTVRAIRPEDKKIFIEEFPEVDQHSLYLRFFETKNAISDAELKYFTEVDFINHVALVVVVDLDGKDKIIGSGRYFAYDRPNKVRTAEVSFLVLDRYQGQGIATMIIKHLMMIARDRGIDQFEAEVLIENAKMLAVFSHTGLPMTRSRDGDVFHVTMALSANVTESNK